MSISSKLGVSQFIDRAFREESQTANQGLGIARTYTSVKTDNFPKPLFKGPCRARAGANLSDVRPAKSQK